MGRVEGGGQGAWIISCVAMAPLLTLHVEMGNGGRGEQKCRREESAIRARQRASRTETCLNGTSNSGLSR